jgi:hypothetical protein
VAAAPPESPWATQETRSAGDRRTLCMLSLQIFKTLSGDELYRYYRLSVHGRTHAVLADATLVYRYVDPHESVRLHVTARKWAADASIRSN